MSLLAFKLADIPIGRTKDVVFSKYANQVLERHYRPTDTYEGYYSPFQTSKVGDRWVQARHSETSLQRVTSGTFGDAILHPKGEKKWGWATDYIAKLQGHLGQSRIPAFDLAAWLYRTEKWNAHSAARDAIAALFRDYSFRDDEIDVLFDVTMPNQVDLAPTAISERDLFELLGNPPGSKPAEGAALNHLEFKHVGPSKHLVYSPAERLNIITGDNSLGKTFILDCIWWALTSRWMGHAAIPRRNVAKNAPLLGFSIAAPNSKIQNFNAEYDWERFRWKRLPKRRAHAGLVVYARYDGSFGVWDPVRSSLLDANDDGRPRGHLLFSRRHIWHGLPTKSGGKTEQWACNGLLRDWISWQSSDRYAVHFKRFSACLGVLSPPSNELLKPGPPVRMPLDSRDIPTLIMPYGEVPVLQASAGVQRILALAYVLVWAWQEHLALCESVRRRPQRRIVMIVDEVEAHLHPKWQRVIVPALVKVIQELSSDVTTQLHVATHSPMVMASIEPEFAAKHDQLHHLNLLQDDVVLEEPSFVKHGTADAWLMSDVFNLDTARSLPGETIIDAAKTLQLTRNPDPQAVRDVNTELVKLLAPDDDFWPRWRHFALMHGVDR